MINMRLAESRGLNEREIRDIRIKQELRKLILKKLEELDPKTQKCELKVLVKLWTQNEFDLQKLWKLPQDKNFHRSFDLPHCTCPKTDNKENLGADLFIKSADCPIHNMED